MRISLFSTVLMMLGWTALVGGEPKLTWPQFRGPTAQGISDAKQVPTSWSQQDNLLWKIKLPGRGTSSPIIVGDKLFVTYYTGVGAALRLHLSCLDRESGKTIWTKDVQPKLPEQERIREDHGYASSTPAADGERVVVFFGKTGVFAFDHAGKELWQADVGDGVHGWGSGASPLLWGDLVFVNASVESGAMFALDKLTGKQVWRTGGIRESWNMPIIAHANGQPELVVAILGKLLAFDPAKGTPLWTCNTDIGWYMVPSLVAQDGVVYCIGGRSGGALAVKAGGRGDVTASDRLWVGRKGSNVTSPILHRGHLYWMHENLGVAYCAEAATGKIVYEERIPGAGQVYASPLLAEGRIYYLGREGRTFVVAAQPDYQLLATNDLRDRSTFNASPAVMDGRLYLRSEQHLYCVGK